MSTFHSKISMLPNNKSYGTVSSYDEDDGKPEEYWTPIKISTESYTTKFATHCVSTSDQSSVASDTSSEENVGFVDIASFVDWFWSILGFASNPLASRSDGRNNKASDMRLSMLSNFGTAYNIVNISMALSIMQELYETTPENKSLCSSASIAGMIIGQLIGGAIGDILGRHMAMAVVMSLQIIGALVSACVIDGPVSIYIFLAFLRFVLGIGCGGVYPLAATITAESASDKGDGGKSVALTFSMQGFGYLVPPFLTTGFMTLFPSRYDLCWRFLLGFGAVPGLCLMVLRLKNQLQQRRISSSQMRQQMILATAREVPVSILDAISLEKDLLRKLIGTGGCWFLFDVLFYGNVLFQPLVLSAAFGPAETVQDTALHTMIVCLLALPGYFVSVISLGRQSPRFIQAQGFLMMAILYGMISLSFQQLGERKVLMIVLYGSTFFFSNYGPNSTVSFR
jgi:PHS family inorganic phosphate transporter-like MFS transporter